MTESRRSAGYLAWLWSTARAGRPVGRVLALCAALLFGSGSLAQTEQADGSSIAALVQHSRAEATEGNYLLASQLGVDALGKVRDGLGEFHPYVAFIADDLAKYAVRLSEEDAALGYSELVMQVLEHGGQAVARYADPLSFNRASLLASLGHFDDAAPLLEASLAVRAANLDVEGELDALRALGISYLELDRLPEARTTFERYDASLRQHAPDDAERILEAALLLSKAWLFADEPERARAVLPSPDDVALAERSIERRSELLLMRSRLALHDSDLDAAELWLNGAATLWKGRENDAPSGVLGAIDFNRARVALLRGDPLLVESLLKSALVRFTEGTITWTPSALRALHGLALANRNLGRLDEADRLLERVIEMRTELFGAKHRSVAEAIGERVLVLIDQGRTIEAIEAAETAKQLILDDPGSSAFQRGLAHNILGFAHKGSGQTERALASFRRGGELLIESRGADSIDLPPSLIASAELLLAAGDADTARAVIDRAERIVSRGGARTADRLGEVLSYKAELAALERRCDAALDSVDRGIDIVLDYRQRSRASASATKLASDRDLIDRLVDTAVRCSRSDSDDDALASLVFRGMQLPQLSSTAGAISRMAQRSDSEEPALAALLRARGDLLDSIAALDRDVEAVWTDGDAPAKRHRDLVAEIDLLDGKLDVVDARLEREFPAFSRYVSPETVSIEAVRASLEPDEAVIVQLTDGNGTWLAFVSTASVRLRRSNLTSSRLSEAVASLRRGLLASEFRSRDDFPALDLAAAHELHAALIAPFEAELAGVEHLLFVADRALQRLPLALLLTEPVDTAPDTLRGHRKLPWLIKRFALSTLPSVDALVSLRKVPGTSESDARAFVGFGDPLFPAPDAESWTGTGTRGTVLARADVRSLRDALPRLEETAAELEEIATAFPVGQSRLFLQDQATESNVKQIDLAPYSVIAFATHGLLADDLAHVREPSLVLTIPDEPTALDNGLLTASEIARLELDADWVVLSACNTASDTPGTGADGLSGLARAFFHAGARSLLVSHWEVNSRAAQLLTTRAIGTHESGDVRGKAQALRESMLYMLSGEYGGSLAHPFYWAPFVQVGDGR